jgi:hypothetical protein
MKKILNKIEQRYLRFIIWRFNLRNISLMKMFFEKLMNEKKQHQTAA